MTSDNRSDRISATEQPLEGREGDSESVMLPSLRRPSTTLVCHETDILAVTEPTTEATVKVTPANVIVAGIRRRLRVTANEAGAAATRLRTSGPQKRDVKQNRRRERVLPVSQSALKRRRVGKSRARKQIRYVREPPPFAFSNAAHMRNALEWRRLVNLPDVLTPRDLIGILGVGRNGVYAALRSGAIPSVRIGQKYLVLKSNLVAFLSGESAIALRNSASAGTPSEENSWGT